MEHSLYMRTSNFNEMNNNEDNNNDARNDDGIITVIRDSANKI